MADSDLHCFHTWGNIQPLYSDICPYQPKQMPDVRRPIAAVIRPSITNDCVARHPTAHPPTYFLGVYGVGVMKGARVVAATRISDVPPCSSKWHW